MSSGRKLDILDVIWALKSLVGDHYPSSGQDPYPRSPAGTTLTYKLSFGERRNIRHFEHRYILAGSGLDKGSKLLKILVCALFLVAHCSLLLKRREFVNRDDIKFSSAPESSNSGEPYKLASKTSVVRDGFFQELPIVRKGKGAKG